MKLLLIVITLFCCSFYTKAQQKVFADKDFYLIDSLVLEELTKENLILIDSCLKIYHNTKADSTKWKLISLILDHTNSKIWYNYLKIAIEITEKRLKKDLIKKERTQFLYYKIKNNENYVYWLQSKGKIEEVIALYYKNIKILRELKNKEQLIIFLSDCSVILSQQGRNSEAISLSKESISIAKEINDKRIINPISKLAKIYLNINENKLAYKLLINSIELINEDIKTKDKALFYSYLGIANENYKKDYKKALFYFNESLKINEEIKFILALIGDYSNIGRINLIQGDTTLGIENFTKSLNLSIKSNFDLGISYNYSKISEIHFNRGNINLSLDIALKAYKTAKNINSPYGIKQSSAILKKIYHEKKDFKNALFYSKEAYEINNSLRSKEMNFSIAKSEAKLEFEQEKKIENIKNNAELLIKEKEREKQTLYKQFAIKGTIFLGLIVGVIIWQLYKSTKKKKEIEETNLKLEEQHKEITSSIVYAQRIQNAILPPIGALQEIIPNSFVAYQPKDIVSGDFYWIEQSKNKVHLAVADCTGHGVPGAMVSVICNGGLNRSVREFQLKKTNEILDKTREIVIQEFEKSGEEDIKDGMDISLVSIDFEANKLAFSGANNPVWIIRKQNEKVELIEIKGDKQPIGNYENAFPFTCKEFDLIKGDSIYLSSDGYADQFGGEKNKKIKSANFKKLLIELFPLEMNRQKEKLEDFFDNWKGDNEQLDDVCVIGFKL